MRLDTDFDTRILNTVDTISVVQQRLNELEMKCNFQQEVNESTLELNSRIQRLTTNVVKIG